MTIWKYSLAITDQQNINIPKDATILSVQKQGDDICLWAMVDEEKPVEQRMICIAGTGQPLHPNWLNHLNYLATVIYNQFVWHVFEWK